MTIRYRDILTASLLLPPGAAMAMPIVPDFGAAAFSPDAAIDNPYFPLGPGQSFALNGRGIEDGEPIFERTELSFGGAGPELLGVQTTIQRDRAFEEGVIVEDTFDYYAQDTGGNVWYFGEDVTNYRYDDDGTLLGTDSESSWLAGENGALPGYIMPADPIVGFEYYQEFAPADAAVDVAVIDAVGLFFEIAGVEYPDVLRIFETNPLEPDSLEYKYYAPGVGLFRIEEDLDKRGGMPGLVFDIEVAPVPVPAALPLLLVSLGGLAVLRRSRRTRQEAAGA